MAVLWVPALGTLPAISPNSWGPALVFLLFWTLNMYVVYLGVESIRKILVFKPVFLLMAVLALLWWAIRAGHGLGPILAQSSKFTSEAACWSKARCGRRWQPYTTTLGLWASRYQAAFTC